jgi:hypothetical protein
MKEVYRFGNNSSKPYLSTSDKQTPTHQNKKIKINH